jgi:transcription elongation factor GreA
MQKDLISEKGFLNFIKEFKDLAEVQKPYWVNEKRIAAELGDRSENAEYIAAKEMLRNLDKRLRFLDKIINNSQVVVTKELSHQKVNFSSRVVVLDLDTKKEKTFIILGTYESNPTLNIISNKSPLGKVLLGKSIGDEFEFLINENTFEYEILSIKASQST